MLSESQLKLVVRKVNAEVNIPLMSEDSEARLIEKMVARINPQIEPALTAIMPAVYVRCLKLALREGMPVEERRRGISELLIGELGGPLARELDARVDSSLLPDSMETSVFQKVGTGRVGGVRWLALSQLPPHSAFRGLTSPLPQVAEKVLKEFVE